MLHELGLLDRGRSQLRVVWKWRVPTTTSPKVMRSSNFLCELVPTHSRVPFLKERHYSISKYIRKRSRHYTTVWVTRTWQDLLFSPNNFDKKVEQNIFGSFPRIEFLQSRARPKNARNVKMQIMSVWCQTYTYTMNCYKYMHTSQLGRFVQSKSKHQMICPIIVAWLAAVSRKINAFPTRRRIDMRPVCPILPTYILLLLPRQASRLCPR